MLLTITSTTAPATDLGYLLAKNPARWQSFELTFGHAHVFYPEASDSRCTAALLVDVDPVALVRGRRGPAGEARQLEQYVNDRPYVASSFLSVAISRVFRSAMAGHSKDRPELAETPMPLEAEISVLPCRGGEPLLRKLFEPLGYAVDVTSHTLDETFPDWGESRYYTVRLTATTRVRDLLTHLYVLVPVLDGDKHYWIGDDEVEKLLRHGEGWLAAHPEREMIARRYLPHRTSLAREAIARLASIDEAAPEDDAPARDQEEEVVEKRINLNRLRLDAVVAALRASGARRVLDLGCGEGRLLRELLEERSFNEIVGVDVSHRALEVATRRLRLDRLPEAQRRRISLLHGSLTYVDRRLEGFDAAAVVEVVEHLDPPRLAAFERILFEVTRPGTVVLTTPNVEYNVKFEGLPAGRLRHRDHRFEWTRAEFTAWAERAASRYGYTTAFSPVGEEDPLVGPPTQMCVFTREGDSEARSQTEAAHASRTGGTDATHTSRAGGTDVTHTSRAGGTDVTHTSRAGGSRRLTVAQGAAQRREATQSGTLGTVREAFEPAERAATDGIEPPAPRARTRRTPLPRVALDALTRVALHPGLQEAARFAGSGALHVARCAGSGALHVARCAGSGALHVARCAGSGALDVARCAGSGGHLDAD